MIRIALFSHDSKLQQMLSSVLGKEFQVHLEPSEAAIHRLFSAAACDVVLLDLDSNYTSIRERLASSERMVDSNLCPVILADDALRSAAMDLVRQGAHSYCRKPPSLPDLKAALQRAYESRSLKGKLENVQQQMEAMNSCDRMIGSSPQIRQVYDLVRRVASLSTSVLVTGESGTGKELAARAIHNLGNRSAQPFVAVSCGAIPETLIEAELFGHEKGAFTGTVGVRQGYLEQAGAGTLFLDEIGELSLITQVKLLRVLQEREFSRLGSSRLIPLRARLVFATHQDLPEMVALGTFRQDLYYRINVMKMDMPALRDHPEDIPLIARHFLRRYTEMHGKHIEEIDPRAIHLLQSYGWPGNARELENVMERAIIVASDRVIHSEDLPAEVHADGVINIEDYRPGGSFERQLRDYKIKLVMAAVKDHQGNKTLAASSLQISRAYLHRLIRFSEADAPSEPALQQVGTA